MSDRLLIGVVSDTHGLLRNEIYAAFEDVSEILHAGDVGDPAILTELEVIAPVHAVYGNVDGFEIRKTVPERLELERAGHKVAVVHGHQWGSPKVADLVSAYSGCSVVIYGHTHQPLVELSKGVLILNPGSAGPKRFSDPVTAAVLTLESGARPAARIVDL